MERGGLSRDIDVEVDFFYESNTDEVTAEIVEVCWRGTNRPISEGLFQAVQNELLDYAYDEVYLSR